MLTSFGLPVHETNAHHYNTAAYAVKSQNEKYAVYMSFVVSIVLVSVIERHIRTKKS